MILAFSDGESGTRLTGMEKELFEVLVVSDALLETVGLDGVSESVDTGKLLERVDVDHLADAIEERNPDLAFDLSDLETVIDRRELLNSIDLLEFAKAKRQLDVELEDVAGEGGLAGVGSNSKASADIAAFVSSLRSEAPETLLEQETTAKARAVQEKVVEGHEELEERYEANKQRFSSDNEQRAPGNPTAVSLLSSGPLPDSVSTRLSTVPSRVLYSKAEPIPRVYSRRWARGRPKRTRSR
ncbi:hypothetical protein [Halobacterium wangiae]|uniref:hypothetical protein n=1 Tax=Halobacterium wangiae TaxID=2902623 RepID=UPI001E32EBE0|nr:hypothetical protein [Halobacterium wangiae]